MEEKNRYQEMYDVVKFARFIEDDLRDAMDKYKIGYWKKHTGNLYRSIRVFAVCNADGTLDRMEITYLNYGKYVDMGVGKGYPTGSRKERADFLLKRNEKGPLREQPGRKPLPWYSKTTYRQTKQLGEFLSKEYGTTMIAIVNEGLPNIIAA